MSTRKSPENARHSRTGILAALPRQEQERLLPHLNSVTLQAGQKLYESGEPARYAYFPESALISLLLVTEAGTSVEVRVIGSEGMLGVPIFLQSETMPYRATVRTAGSARSMKSDLLKEEFGRCGPFHDLLLRYLHVLVVQLSQMTVCNRFHSVGQRLGRWLLATQDRVKLTRVYPGFHLSNVRNRPHERDCGGWSAAKSWADSLQSGSYHDSESRGLGSGCL